MQEGYSGLICWHKKGAGALLHKVQGQLSDVCHLHLSTRLATKQPRTHGLVLLLPQPAQHLHTRIRVQTPSQRCTSLTQSLYACTLRISQHSISSHTQACMLAPLDPASPPPSHSMPCPCAWQPTNKHARLLTPGCMLISTGPAASLARLCGHLLPQPPWPVLVVRALSWVLSRWPWRLWPACRSGPPTTLSSSCAHLGVA